MNELIGQLPGKVNELIFELVSHPVTGDLGAFGISQYTFWMLVSTLILCVVLFVFVKKQSQDVVPRGKFVNGVEFVIEYARDNILKSTVGPTWRKHFPFIATVFFFVLFNDFMGVIPGAKPGTGSIAMTSAVALCSFVYFIYIGIQKRGAWGYIKSLAPKGVMFPINIVVWCIEVFSTVLRLITLAVRLFCNMFAGHVFLGAFAIMSSLFFSQLATGITGATIAQAGISVGWELILIIIYAVEFLVSVVQAFVFALLSSVYVQLAESE